MKKENDLIENTDYEIEDLFDEPKFMTYLYHGAFAFGACMLSTSVLMPLGVPFAIGFLVSLPTMGPLSLFGLHCMKKRIDRNYEADMQMSHQLVRMFNEVYESDHKLTPTSSCFYREIRSKEHLRDINSDAVNNMSQFLCMINANYYDEINSLLTTKLSREALIDKVLDQIDLYVSKYGLASFTIIQVKDIINGCIFIDDELKKSIIKEYKNSAIHIGTRKVYRILNKNINSKKDIDQSIKEMKEERHSTEHYMKTFDVEDVKWYEYLLECASKVEENKYGSPYDVEWDLYALRDVMAFMLINFRTKLTEAKGEYFNSEVVMSFMYNVFVYATVNNTGHVGINEIIQTFKNWDFFEGLFNLKLEVLDAIFDHFDLDYSMHPYHNKKAKKNKGQVLSFPKK